MRDYESVTIFDVQWNLSNADTIGTHSRCLEYQGVHIPVIFPVGVAISI